MATATATALSPPTAADGRAVVSDSADVAMTKVVKESSATVPQAGEAAAAKPIVLPARPAVKPCSQRKFFRYRLPL